MQLSLNLYYWWLTFIFKSKSCCMKRYNNFINVSAVLYRAKVTSKYGIELYLQRGYEIKILMHDDKFILIIL